jgi:putative transposase
MKRKKIILNTIQKTILKKYSVQRNIHVSLQERSKIIEYLGKGYSNMRYERETGIKLEKAQRWRAKWLSYEEIFAKIMEEFKGREQEIEMEEAIKKCLSDKPRKGAPSKISTEQYCQILGVSLELPEKSGRPITQWTLTELTDEVIKRGIVPTISRAQVGSFLKGERFKAP